MSSSLPTVPQLRINDTSFLVYDINDTFPPVDLLLVPDTGRIRPFGPCELSARGKDDYDKVQSYPCGEMRTPSVTISPHPPAARCL